MKRTHDHHVELLIHLPYIGGNQGGPIVQTSGGKNVFQETRPSSHSLDKSESDIRHHDCKRHTRKTCTRSKISDRKVLSCFITDHMIPRKTIQDMSCDPCVVR